MPRVHLAASAICGLALIAHAQQTRVEPVAGAWPGVRNAHAMTFDAARGRVVLFGGADAERVRSDTWSWDAAGGRWDEIDTAGGPEGRTFPAFAYDESRGEALLFGGNRVLFGRGGDEPTVLGDTWTLRGDRWQRRDVAGPSPRAEAAMAFDPRRGRLVLFGGYTRSAAGTVRYGDTWEWDGERWHLVAEAGPAPRNGTALAFDETRRVVVLSGGPPAFVGPETWEWDGRTWHERPEPAPPGRFNPVMVFHRSLGALVRFGGWTGRERAGDTWTRRGLAWEERPVAGPSPRNHAAMAYDHVRGRAVLFGGHDGDFVFGDTWEFDGRAWHQVGHATPVRRVNNGH